MTQSNRLEDLAASPLVAASALPPQRGQTGSRTPARSETDQQKYLASLCPDWRPPSMVLDAGEGRILYSNRQGARLLRSGAIVRIAGGRLDFQVRSFNRRFRESLNGMVEQGMGSVFLAGRHPETKDRFLVALHPVREVFDGPILVSNGGGAGPAKPIVAELTVGADQPNPCAVEALAEESGLSPAETHLLLLIAGGSSLEEIAAQRGVRLNTVRQQMKSVLNKTGSRRQQELIKLVLTLCPSSNAEFMPVAGLRDPLGPGDAGPADRRDTALTEEPKQTRTPAEHG